jgi:hypothetical protein
VVHNYRKLNSLLIKDSYPMRNLFELIDEVGQGQIYSIIDLSQGFFCQTLTEDSKAYTIRHLGSQGKDTLKITEVPKVCVTVPPRFKDF